ncbi:hypothetical protein GXW82_44030 [Streptacidiphilus sp. 4-A2]|nr:hypothetical protein [Streptacidiphilus sp. 4-A2]
MTTEDILQEAARLLEQHLPPHDTDDLLNSLAHISPTPWNSTSRGPTQQSNPAR